MTGAEVDRIVIQDILGLYGNRSAGWYSKKHKLGDFFPPPLSPSTDIAVAFKVVAKFGGWAFDLAHRDVGWECVLTDPDEGYDFRGEADTAPLAICIAALAASGIYHDGVTE